MTVPRWTNSRDGIQRLDLRMTFRLDVEDLARLLAAATPDLIPDTHKEVRDMVRNQLYYSGRDAAMDAPVTDAHREAVRLAYRAP